MNSIHTQEDFIFIEYQKLLGDGSEVSTDGLHYLGDFYYENDCWGRLSGNEEVDWKRYCEQKRGLVVLTKDLNDNTAWDIREEHGRQNKITNPTPTNHIFYRNLRRWVYALLNIDNKGNIPKFPDTKTAQKCFETKPWVRINLKKTPGGSFITNQTLAHHIQAFRSLIVKQLGIYKEASIYLDCTRRYGIELLRELYPDIKAFGNGVDEWIYFSEKYHFIVVNSYHPSSRIEGGEEAYYNRMKVAVHSFFQEHPQFFYQGISRTDRGLTINPRH